MKFNLEGPFWQFVTLCVRFFALNILFITSAIPIVTLGSARVALYSTVFAYTNNEDLPLCREYVKRFLREFVRSIGASVFFSALAMIIIFGVIFWNSLDTGLTYIALPILIIASVVLVISFEYYFPLQARFENSFMKTILNALRLPWAVPGPSVAIVCIDVAAGVLFTFTGFFRIVFILLGCAWLAYAKSLLYLHIFNKAVGGTRNINQKMDYTLPSASVQ